MFPDPEAFNPLRWVEPSYPSYREPLTEYPTIINSTQFGYGRRVCQGQTVADEDLLIGIGSIAWLFRIDRITEENPIPIGVPDVVSDPEKIEARVLGMNDKATVSNEELNTGVKLDEPTMEDKILTKYNYPGSSPTLGGKVQEACATVKTQVKKVTDAVDPTLDFTTLLIAKPLPFKFNLRPRDSERASRVREMFSKGVEHGDYSPSREYWGENQGRDKPLGWGKV
jgi:hypothetical protein